MRTKPTTGNLGPRDPGPHGITLAMRYMGRDTELLPRRKRTRDRSLAGKARIRARRATKAVS